MAEAVDKDGTHLIPRPDDKEAVGMCLVLLVALVVLSIMDRKVGMGIHPGCE